MFGFKTGASAKEEKKPAPSGTPQGNQPKSAPSPNVLGNGAAASAGFALKNRRAQIDAAAGYADGGKVVGPGTGTSDDIEAVVPEGSYIMPADSTAQIGEQNMASLGAPVPVNLSNGEYQLPPEQVHAVGVQALEQMKNATHTPAAMQDPAAAGRSQGAGFKPEMFFADGGPVFSNVDPDELGRNNAPKRGVKPAQPPMYVDSAGRVTQDMPSQSRAVTPAGPRIDYSNSRELVAGKAPNTLPAVQAAPQAQAQPQGRADFYTNARGETARGFGSPSTRAVVPTQQPPAPTPQALPSPQAAPASAPRTPDYQARARVMQNAAMDAAAWDAERAKMDAKFASASAGAPAGGQPSGARGFLPQKLGMAGGAGAVLGAIPEAISVAEVAQSDNATGLDVANQAAEGLGRWGAMTAGAAIGAKGGAALGALGGPAAPVTVPLGGVLGGIVGGGLGFFGADKAIEAGRSAVGADTQSPIDRVKAEPASMPVAAPVEPGAQAPAASAQPPQQKAAQAQATTQAQADPAAAADLPNNIIRDGNSFSASGPIRPGFTVNGQQAGGALNTVPAQRSAQNEAAVQALMARTPAFGQGAGAQQAAGFNPGIRASGIRDSSQMDAQQRKAFAAASTPHKGSQNGQLTAAQINAMRGLIGDVRTDATSRANNTQNNEARMDEAVMREQAADRRSASQDQLASRRNELDERRLIGEEETRGFTTRAAQRTEKLYERYEAATTDEERAAIAKKMRELSGKEEANRFTVVPGGQEVDPLTQQLVTRPAMVLNNQTGQFVMQGQQQPNSAGAEPLANHIQALKNNPSMAAQFDAKYGAGAAARYLGAN